MPKNDLTYGRIIDALSNARRGWKSKATGLRGPPMIAMDALADNTRNIIKDFNDQERSLEDYIEDGIAHFKMLPNGFQTLIPRWLDQPNYVELWVEKQGMAADVQRALQGRHIVIAPNKGVSSITFIHENIERVIDQFIEHNREKVYILYLGDLDPHGWDMDRLIKEDLAKQIDAAGLDDDDDDASRFVFKRIGITMAQIKKFKLTHLMHPDAQTVAKFENHPKVVERFKKEFRSVFQIELEAFQTIPFILFQQLITDEIDKLYDEDVHEEVLARPEYSQEPDEIKEQIREALNQLLDEL